MFIFEKHGMQKSGFVCFGKSVVWYKGWNKNKKGGFQTPMHTMKLLQLVKLRSHGQKWDIPNLDAHPLKKTWESKINFYSLFHLEY